jgi:hypothetical protein
MAKMQPKLLLLVCGYAQCAEDAVDQVRF